MLCLLPSLAIVTVVNVSTVATMDTSSFCSQSGPFSSWWSQPAPIKFRTDFDYPIPSACTLWIGTKTSSWLVADRSYLFGMVHTLQVYILTSHKPVAGSEICLAVIVNWTGCYATNTIGLTWKTAAAMKSPIKSCQKKTWLWEIHTFRHFPVRAELNSFKQVDLACCLLAVTLWRSGHMWHLWHLGSGKKHHLASNTQASRKERSVQCHSPFLVGEAFMLFPWRSLKIPLKQILTLLRRNKTFAFA